MSFTAGHALLIGVGTYHHLPELNLGVTVTDVESLAVTLADPQIAGYPSENITVLHETTATRTGILDALANLAARTTPDSTVFLYYAGHGYYDQDQVYYLTAHDTQMDGKWLARDSGVRQDELLRAMQAIPAKRMLLLFNACHAGEISPTLTIAQHPALMGINPPPATAAALLATGEGRIIITACRAKQVSHTGGGQTTVFANAITEGLQGQGISNRGGYVSAFDLYTTVYTNVRERVRTRHYLIQEPEITVLHGIGPFAIALYPGELPTAEPPATLGGNLAPDTAVRTFSVEETQTALQQLLASQSRIHIGDSQQETTTASDEATIVRDQAMQAGPNSQQARDGGINIHAPNSQGITGRAGTVTQHFGALPPTPPTTATTHDNTQEVSLPSIAALLALYQPTLAALGSTVDGAIQDEIQLLLLQLKTADTAASAAGRQTRLKQALDAATALADYHPVFDVLRFVLFHMTR